MEEQTGIAISAPADKASIIACVNSLPSVSQSFQPTASSHIEMYPNNPGHVEGVKTSVNIIKDLNIECNDVIKVNVEDHEFQACKCILSLRSPVFALMIQHKLEEKSSEDIVIWDCDASCFKYFLLFLHTGDESHVTADNAFDLFKIAKRYKVRELKQAIIKFLKKNLQIETVLFDPLDFAIMQDDSELWQVIIKCFARNISKLQETPQWEVISTERQSSITKLLRVMSEKFFKVKTARLCYM